MTDLPLHPKLVHLPIALAILLPLISGGLLLAWIRGWLPGRAWWLAVFLHIGLVASAWLAMSTGESEEERVEAVVPEAAIEAHEEAAETFTWVAAGLLVLTLGTVLVGRFGERPARAMAAASLAGALVILWLGYRVGEAGGELVYRHGAASAYTTPPAGAGEPTAEEPSSWADENTEQDDDD